MPVRNENLSSLGFKEPDCEAALKQYEIESKNSYSLRLSMIEEKYSCLANNKLYSPKTQTRKEYEKSEHVKEKLLDYIRLNISSSSSSKQDFGDQWQDIEERIKNNQVVNSNLLKTKKGKSKGVAKYSKLLQNENYNDDHYENDSISVDDIDKWGSSHESFISKNLSFETHAEIDIRNNVSKNSDVSHSRSENINKMKRKRGRPPKFDKESHCSSKSINKINRKHCSPPKFDVGSHCSSKSIKNIKRKRGRPPKFDVDVKEMHQNNLTKSREQESKKPSQDQNLRDKDAQLKNSQTDLNNSADNLEMTERENSFLTLDNKQQGNNTWSPKRNFKCNESQIKSNTNTKNLKIKLNEPNISQEKVDSETELFGKGNKIHMNELSASYLKNNFTLRTPLTTIEEEESFSQIGSSEKAGNINNYQRKLCKEIPTYNLNSNFGSNIKKSVVKTIQTTDNLRNETEINGNLNNREEITVSSHANVTERKNSSLELRLRPLRVEMLRNGTEINSRIDNKEEVNLVKKANLKPPLKSLEEDMRNRIEINGDLDKREEINVSSHTCPAERKIRSLKLRLKSSEGNVKNGTEINRNLNSQEQITVSFHTSPEERETRRLELRLKSSEENLKNRTERNRNLSNKTETILSSHTSPEERKTRRLELRLKSSEENLKNGTERNRNLNNSEETTVSSNTSPEERRSHSLKLQLNSSEESLKNGTERNRNLSNKKETTISSHTSPEERKPRTLKLRLNSNGPVINSTLLPMKREEYEMSIRASKSSLMKSTSTLKENSSNESTNPLWHGSSKNESRNPLWHGSSKNENNKTVSALSYERSPPISDDSQEKLLPIDFSSYTFLSVEDTKIGKAGENILLGCSYSKFDRAMKSLRLVE
ncbi:UNVERIFIED_CONTAM: hypothetical protein RMT77_016587 [Armadillidium vulgare]